MSFIVKKQPRGTATGALRSKPALVSGVKKALLAELNGDQTLVGVRF